MELIPSAQNSAFAELARGGFYLLNDEPEESHQISQSHESATASYWHGIMHRREPDYGNANYWWRQTGSHELFPDIYKLFLTLSNTAKDCTGVKKLSNSMRSWDPKKFTAACEQSEADDNEAMSAFLKEMQHKEMLLLLEYTYGKATE